ncbi:28S ribosomal protein S35, mitochondrial-like [Daphnia pulicaria]|uniref:28S ribosomal protein S35, mitochondrial-like n=1 Tax=Daphnia pulicaria TaxID=35523 RepID=UPI001EEA967A|nr:28S ribosomal protein S35, mitochondrial-like [Daphnia pulicaria]
MKKKKISKSGGCLKKTASYTLLHLAIPNFLHLTPPAIERQCKELKKFCKEWTKELDTNEKIENHLPITITTSDYLHSSPSLLRDARSRIVTLQVKLRSLKLDNHAKDKLLRLVKERYNPETDVLTIVSERCPLIKPNVDYPMYLQNVLVSESWPWEDEKCGGDMEKYLWEGSQSQLATNSGSAALTNAGQRESPRHAAGNRTVRSLCW